MKTTNMTKPEAHATITPRLAVARRRQLPRRRQLGAGPGGDGSPIGARRGPRAAFRVRGCEDRRGDLISCRLAGRSARGPGSAGWLPTTHKGINMTTATLIDADMDALLACGARIVQVARGDKRPLGNAWQTLATEKPERIAAWLDRGSNVGILLGAANLIDVEFDDADGRQQLAAMGLLDVETPTWASGRGEHRLFRLDDPLPTKGWVKRGGLEIRLGGKPAQSVLPPSVHPSGRPYTWLVSPQQCGPAVVTLEDLRIG